MLLFGSQKLRQRIDGRMIEQQRGIEALAKVFGQDITKLDGTKGIKARIEQRETVIEVCSRRGGL